MSERDPVKEAIIAGLIAIAVVAVQYSIASQGVQIELKARLMGLRRWLDGTSNAWLDWKAGRLAPAVVNEAEGILEAEEVPE